MKVLFLTNIPSPYRVNFFNEFGKLCDLTVVFERFSSSERDASWKKFQTENFKPVMLKGIKRGVANAVCPSVIKYLKKEYDHIIVTNFASPTGMLAIAYMRMMKIPYWLESDGGFAKDGKGFKEALKRFFMGGAKGYFSTAEEHDRYYLQYGAQPEQIHRYPFTSLYRSDILDTPVTAEQKQKLREKLGITEPRVLLSVGQFVRRKGYDVLFEALPELPGDMGCYIVGGEPTEAYLTQLKKLGLQSVHFVGFQPKQVLADYFMAADVFVLPTREDIWGLVVNEAMAKGLPVVTTQRCVAGLELITESALGQLVPVEDPKSLAKAIENTYTAADSTAVLHKVSGYCFEEMAKRHIEILTGF